MRSGFPRSSTSRRGLTIPEILVGGTLGLIVSGVCLFLMVSLGRFGLTITTKAELQQMAGTAINRMAADARLASVASVGTAEHVLGLVKLIDLDAQGHKVWDGRPTLYYWRPSERILKCKSCDESHRRLDPLTLARLLQPGNGSETRVASGVTFFRAQLAGTPNAPEQPLTIELELTQETDRVQKVRLQKSIYLRNAP